MDKINKIQWKQADNGWFATVNLYQIISDMFLGETEWIKVVTEFTPEKALASAFGTTFLVNRTLVYKMACDLFIVCKRIGEHKISHHLVFMYSDGELEHVATTDEYQWKLALMQPLQRYFNVVKAYKIKPTEDQLKNHLVKRIAQLEFNQLQKIKEFIEKMESEK